MATTMHCEPYLSEASRMICGLAIAAELKPTLSAPALSRRRTSATVRTPPPLVGALLVVARGDLDRVTGVAQLDEVDALDDPPARHVQAGDDAFGQHQAPPLSSSAPDAGQT